MSKNLGNNTIFFEKGPSIISSASVVGKMEGDGPLSNFFDMVENDQYFGQSTWEKAESELCKRTVNTALKKANLSFSDIDFAVSGDLLNQCIGSTFGMRDSDTAYLGIFGACSTMAEGLFISSVLVDSGAANYVISSSGSHFCSSERQFRQPLEYGGQRPQTSQWTVTGGGSIILGKNASPPYITHATVGKIIDKNITDTNNMGSAMAPAFCDTILSHFKATNRSVDYYDLIVSGDLGYVGSMIAKDLLKENGLDISKKYNDCGLMIFDRQKQDVHSGGSGCGCGASVLSGYILHQMREKKLNKVLFVATGALMSQTSSFQGESIPSVAHAIAIEN